MIKEVKNTFGVSFSIKYCQELGVDWQEVLLAALDDLKIKRYRLMSYWDLVEQKQGKYDFTGLDWQFEQISKYNAKVSLAVGMRQPRYPECHLPSWAKVMPEAKQQQALYKFLTAVIKRYQNHPALESYQLENEALNHGIGECTDYNRVRLQHEFNLIKKLDNKHPVIMSTSNSWGLPLRSPLPDIVGFSVYFKRHYKNGRYFASPLPAWFYRMRAHIIRISLKRPVIIHELQAEPWGPQATVNLSISEQNKTMNAKRLQKVIQFASATGIEYIDLWGIEWWYWRMVKHHDSTLWKTARQI
jgi:hypothetical protein